MLLFTSFIGSVIGFIVCFQILVKLQNTDRLSMRVCMMNSMVLSFIFAMFIELSTGSKILSILLPMLTICLPIFWMTKFNLIDTIEACTGTLMSVSMSVMFIGMIDSSVIFIIQGLLVMIETILLIIVFRGSYSRI